MKKNNMTKTSRTDLARIDAMKDGDIDYSDIPALDDDFIDKATLVPAKQSVTIRLDSDVVTWLKEGGKGYQTRANRILRVAMELHQNRAHGKSGRSGKKSP